MKIENSAHGYTEGSESKEDEVLYFKLSTNEYGKHWLFYKPLKEEPGKYGCWMPIDDKFYNEFRLLESLRDQLAAKEKHYAIVEKSIQQLTDKITEIVHLNEECRLTNEVNSMNEMLKQREEGNNEIKELKEVIKELIFHLDTRNVPLENTPRIDLAISKARKLINDE